MTFVLGEPHFGRHLTARKVARRESLVVRSVNDAVWRDIASEQAFDQSRGRDDSPFVIGVSSGPLCHWFCHQCSASEWKEEYGYRPVASESTKQELRFLGLPLDETQSPVDLLVVQADEVDDLKDEVWWIDGRGHNGPQTSPIDLQALKDAVASCSRCIVLTRSDVGRLGGRLPVVIDGDEFEWEEIAEEVDDLLVTDAEITRRSHREEANTRGIPDPVVGKTQYGTPTMILDCSFYEGGLRLMGEKVHYGLLKNELENIPGVVATGLFGVEKDRATVYRIPHELPTDK